MVAGLVVIVLGLTCLVFGVLLGVWTHEAERPLYEAAQQAILGMTADAGEDFVISEAAYAPPSVMQTVMAQPLSWLGGLSLAVGFALMLRSIPQAPDSESSSFEYEEPAVSTVDDGSIFVFDD